jgi:hypothetical protein
MKTKKYYAILQEKTKNSKGETIIKEYVHDVEGIAPNFARNEAEDFASENGMTVRLLCAYR